MLVDQLKSQPKAVIQPISIESDPIDFDIVPQVVWIQRSRYPMFRMQW